MLKKIMMCFIACIVLLYCVPSSAVNADDGFSYMDNSKFIFKINKENGCFTVENKLSGYVYRSNPEIPDDEFSGEALYSLLNIEYYTKKHEKTNMNSYEHSTKLSKPVITSNENVTAVTYIFGRFNIERTMIPGTYTQDEFDKLLEDDNISEELFKSRYSLTELSDDDGSLAEQYPLLKKQPLYILQKYTPDYDIENIYYELKASGFTREMLEKHNLSHGIEVEYQENTQISITVEYTLTDDGFTASVQCDKIESTDEAILTSIDLLPFYESAVTGEEGYILVPDGSGALIDFAGKNLALSGVKIPIYGSDGAKPVLQMVDSPNRAIMPVFGISRTKTGTLAVIEQGDAVASICCDKSSSTLPVNNVFARFNIHPYEQITLDSLSSKTTYNVYGKDSYAGVASVKYILLNGNTHTYAGMASVYRNYLLNNDMLTKNPSAGYPLSVEFLGALGKQKSFLGIKYTKIHPLTTFYDATALINELKMNSINDLIIKYSGWFNNGLVQGYGGKIKVVSGLGGAKGLKTFNNMLAEQDIKSYYGASFQQINEKLVNSKINVFSDGLRYVYRDIASIYRFNPATTYRQTWKAFGTNQNEPQSYLLSPKYIPRVLDSFWKENEKNGQMNINYDDFGSSLNSDFSTDNFTNRQDSSNIIAKSLKNTSNFSVDGGDLYTLKNASHIFNLSSVSSRKLIYDREVPFVQMVLHGLISYSAPPINLAYDPESALLKAIETGSVLNYTFAYRNQNELKNSDFNYYYSVSFDAWAESIRSAYLKIAGIQKDLSSMQIKDHVFLSDKVTMTVYENETKVIVNYSDEPFEYGGALISAKDFTYYN